MPPLYWPRTIRLAI